MHKRFQRAYTTIKENTFVSYAKIATVGGFCNVDLVLVKATSPEDIPLRDRYVLQLLKIFAVSPESYHTFASSFSRRFSNSKCWRVALKCLILLHRLLRSLPYDTPFRTELLWARSNGLLSLNPCPFRDTSSCNSHDYTQFILSYANLLDEALYCLTLDSEQINEDLIEKHEYDDQEEMMFQTYPDKMKRLIDKLEILQQFQSLIDRVIECKPNGQAARSFLVHSTLKYIVRDSFFCYTNFNSEIGSVLDHLIQLPYRSCMIAFVLYKKAAIQADRLIEFYDWCKSVGLCGTYEYPVVDRIPEIQIQALENFLSGMWELSDSSSSNGSPIASTVESALSSIEDDAQIVRFNDWVRFDEDEKITEKALISFETNTSDKKQDDVMSWEVLLEASLILAPLMVSNNYFYFEPESKNESNDLQIQVYNPCVINPFLQSNYGYNSLNLLD
ncbi:putative clathrin assembly protein At1g03050 [Rutidosis leptorrhynchoides]|uniref:putative clathrin assembly protein At1g03050 n=1 Tax=Rutidosis leptorrhynchoides TaxID=125765 RepID=UPI003A9A542D